MAKANRLMDIWLYITEKRRFQAQEIADEFQLSVRTVNRYMNDLADLGIPIMSVQGRGGGFELLNNGLLPPISFTEEETLSIFFAYHALRNYHQLPFEAEYSSVTRKLYNLLAKNKKMQVDKFSEHLAFRIPKRQLKTPYLRPLMNASLNKNEIKIAYQSKSGLTNKLIIPIGIYTSNGLWYCPAFDQQKKRMVLLRVDRIETLFETNIQSKIESLPNLDEWFNDNSKQTTKNPVQLYVKLTREGARQCKSNPWLEKTITENEDGSGYIQTWMEKSEQTHIASYFFSLKNEAFIIEPASLAQEVVEMAQQLINHYQNQDPSSPS